MKKLHLITGCIFFCLFLATGVYMLLKFPDLYQEKEEVRMMFRSTHIYLLLASLLNIQASNSEPHVNGNIAKYGNCISSCLLIISQPIIFLAFIMEPPAYLIERPFSFFGILFLVIGVILSRLSKSKWLSRHAIQKSN